MKAIALAMLATMLPVTLHADRNPRIIPPNTRVGLVYSDGEIGEFQTGEESEFVYSQSVNLNILASDAARERCQNDLKQTAKELRYEQDRQKPNRWIQGAMWSGIGAAVIGAFFLGTKF